MITYTIQEFNTVNSIAIKGLLCSSPSTTKMKNLVQVLPLYLMCLYGCLCQEDDPQDFMLLAGPLTNHLRMDLSTKPIDAFDCSHPLPLGSRPYFQYLQSRGVTHFKVPLSWAQLLPTGDPSQPSQPALSCYRTFLEQLVEAGLKPLVVLHRSALPEALRSRYGGWESAELPDVFQQYAEFVFLAYGELAHSWVTLSHLEELRDAGQLQLKHALHAHANV